MDSSCFCVSHSKDANPPADEMSSMELDAAVALAELKMLSQAKHEAKQRRKRLGHSLSSSNSICVVQMNSKFVTHFSVPKSSRRDSDSDKDPSNQSSSRTLDPPPDGTFKQDPDGFPTAKWMGRDVRSRTFSSTKGICRYKPYALASVTRDAPSQMRLEDLSVGPLPANVADRAHSPAVPRQDSGNKSNPSSPAKSQSGLSVKVASSIVRSRSLDDLEIGKLEDSKVDSCYGRCDIDTVSQHISKLHVS